MKPHSAPTLIDVARIAGVSFKTVSRVMNGEPNVRPETCARVREVCERLNYKTNVSARNLRSGRPKIMAFFFRQMVTSEHETLHREAIAFCRENGMHLISEQFTGDYGFLKETLRNLMPHIAVVLPPMCDDAIFTNALETAKIPTIHVSPRMPLPGRAELTFAARKGTADMVSHLIRQGHDRIGYIGCSGGDTDARERYLGYRDALPQNGIVFDQNLVRSCESAWFGARAATADLLALQTPPTAIVADSDRRALATLSWLNDHGILVPRQISVAGIGDTSLAELAATALTTVRLPVRAALDRSMKEALPAARFAVSEHAATEPEIVWRKSASVRLKDTLRNAM